MKMLFFSCNDFNCKKQRIKTTSGKEAILSILATRFNRNAKKKTPSLRIEHSIFVG